MDFSKKRKSADDLEHTAKRAAVESVARNQVIINLSDDEDEEYHVMSDEEYCKFLEDNVEYVVGGGAEEEIPQRVSACDENEDPEYHVLSDEEYDRLCPECTGYVVGAEDDDYPVLSWGECERLNPGDCVAEDDDYHVMSDEEYYKYLTDNVEYVVGGE